MLIRLFALATLCVSAATQAAPALPNASHASPDGRLSVVVTTDNNGRPSYSILRGGREVVAPSRLGFMFLDAPKFERNMVIDGQRTRVFDQTWEQPWGERREVRNHYNELRVTLSEKNPPRRGYDVVFRLFDDGVGFRYEFPDQPQLQHVRISEELTEFQIADEATAWWIPAGEWNRGEYLYHRTPL